MDKPPIKKFVFTVAPSGSGKSTCFPTGFEADKYPNLYLQNGSINKKLLHLAHQKCLQDCIDKMISQDVMVIQTNTNLNPKHLIEYMKACVKYNYQVKCILPTNDLLYYDGDEVNTRSKQIKKIITVRSSGPRIIPEDALYQMVNNFDSVRSFYKKMETERNPNIWLNAIEDPFFNTNTYSVSILGINRNNLEQKIKNNDDITLYTQLNDELFIFPDSEDDYQSTNLIQTENRNFSILLLKSKEKVGYIILWNDGISEIYINRFLETIKY